MHLAMTDKELGGQAAASISLTFMYTFDKVKHKFPTVIQDCCKTKHASKKADTTRTSSISRRLPKRHDFHNDGNATMSQGLTPECFAEWAETIVAPCANTPGHCGSSYNRHFNRQHFTSPSNHSRAVHQAHLLIMIQVVPSVEKTFHTGLRAWPLKNCI